jgi:hypothetical protein
MNDSKSSSVSVAQISASPLNPNFQDPLSLAMFQDPAWKSEKKTHTFQFAKAAPLGFFSSERRQSDFEKVWEKDLFYNPKVERKIYSLENFEADILASENREAFAISRNARPASREELQGTSNLDKFKWMSHTTDFSCRLLELDRFSENSLIRKLRDELVQWIGGYIHVTAFYSCPGQSVIPLHWDTENLFIYQAHGRKTWLLGKPTLENPMRLQNPGSLKGLVNQVADAGVQITLEEGDLLYVPRGWFHKATADEKTASLHVTFGISHPTIMDNIIDVINSGLFGLTQNPELRSSINFHDSDQIASLVQSALKHIESNLGKICQKSLVDEWRHNYPLGRYNPGPHAYHQLSDVMLVNRPLMLLSPQLHDKKWCEISRTYYVYFEGIKVTGSEDTLNKLLTLICAEKFYPSDLSSLVGAEVTQTILFSLISSGSLELLSLNV